VIYAIELDGSRSLYFVSVIQFIFAKLVVIVFMDDVFDSDYVIFL
jgi:hypothetical protein